MSVTARLRKYYTKDVQRSLSERQCCAFPGATAGAGATHFAERDAHDHYSVRGKEKIAVVRRVCSVSLLFPSIREFANR